MTGPIPAFLTALAIAAPALVPPALAQEPVLEIAPLAPSDRTALLDVYSSLDTDLARPLLDAFQRHHPELGLRYESLLTGDIHKRIMQETDAQGATADFVFSSAMDLQVKLANDGYAAEIPPPDGLDWPDWADWRHSVYALTFEPAVFAYHKPSFAQRAVPASRRELVAWLQDQPAGSGRIGTYDPRLSGVGYLFMARDQEIYADIWQVVEAMGRAGLQRFATSGALLEQVADGRIALGYNLLGSYTSDWAEKHPDLGLLVPQDFTVVVSRVGLVPSAARNPEAGTAFLHFLMSDEGQDLLSRSLRLSAVSLGVGGRGAATPLPELEGTRLKPLAVSAGLLAYLDQATRDKLLSRWDAALAKGKDGAAQPPR